MKILAIEREISSMEMQDTKKILAEEAMHVFELYLNNKIREIYFTENKTAVLILETETREAATALLNEFPLVKNGIIRFDIMELWPYTGYERLIWKVHPQ